MLRGVTVPSNIRPLPPPLNRNGETPTYIAGRHADIRGAELSTIFRPANDKWIDGHYAYTNINSNDCFADASAPRQAFTFFAATALPSCWNLSASHGFVGRMQWYVDAADRVGPCHHSALRLARHFASRSVGGEVALGIDRLFGTVADYVADRQRPTQGFATLRLVY